MSDTSVRLDDLVDSVVIAKRLGVRDYNVVNTWRRRHPDFPEPVVTLPLGRIWSWHDVEAWARRTGRLPKSEPAGTEQRNLRNLRRGG